MGMGGFIAGGAGVHGACVQLCACAFVHAVVRIYVTLRFSCVVFLRYAWYVLTSRVYIY